MLFTSHQASCCVRNKQETKHRVYEFIVLCAEDDMDHHIIETVDYCEPSYAFVKTPLTCVKWKNLKIDADFLI